MAFKIQPFYNLNQTPIYRTLEEDGVLGIANDAGTIRLNKDLTNPAQMQAVIDHEMVHIDQMRHDSNDTGNFAYDNENMYYTPKGSSKTITTRRSDDVDGSPSLKQEKEANDPKVQKKIKNKYNGRG
jgi:hypothetical protein